MKKIEMYLEYFTLEEIFVGILPEDAARHPWLYKQPGVLYSLKPNIFLV
jgi:hypothetical protein